MKLLSVIRKSIREQWRHFWILLLTLSMAPFFVLVYYLINEASKPHYDLLVVNRDLGADGGNSGEAWIGRLQGDWSDSTLAPLHVTAVDDSAAALRLLRSRKADALILLPRDFSLSLQSGEKHGPVQVELIGDLTDIQYMVTAVWTGEHLAGFIHEQMVLNRPLVFKETALGMSGRLDDFDLYVPGLLILSTVMLMFSSAIALVTEVENRTILRLKLSRVKAVELLSGITLVQLGVGMLSVLFTLLVALGLGFDLAGSAGLFVAICILTSLSIIAFSLILAAATRTANEILVIGNFPLFLFMFFTGAAFPISGRTLFKIGGYPVTLQGLMSPTHAVSALKKVLIFDMSCAEIVPELLALSLLTLTYFTAGVWAFGRRHMRVE